MYRIAEVLLDLLFPSVCVFCGGYLPRVTPSTPLCANCFSSIAIESAFLCPKCGARCVTPIPCHSEEGFILAAATSFSGAARELIHVLKYGRVKRAAEPLASILAIYLKKLEKNCDFSIKNLLVIPMPLHPRRRRERGFNQTESILDALSRRSVLPPFSIARGILLKTKYAPSQTEMEGYTRREENVQNSFSLTSTDRIRGKSVLLFDDVTTSGATLREATRVLKKEGGAKKVFALVVAKA